MAKVILLDGGPCDGDVIQVDTDSNIFKCVQILHQTGPDEITMKYVYHIYREDPRVLDHFIYLGVE